MLKKSSADAFKTALKRTIQKTARATGGLISNKIADALARTTSQNALSKSKHLWNKKHRWNTKKSTCHLKKGNKLLMN